MRLGKLLILAALAMFSSLVAAKPQPYGEHFLRLDDMARVGSGASATRVEDPAGFHQQMEAMEIESGPYADGLAEPLGSLGRYYRQQGEYEQALEAYRRALHIVRVNDGLYSDRQVPLVRELLAIYRDAGDFETLDQRYDYLFRLYGAGRPPYTDLRMRAALEYLRWQREAMRMNVGSNTANRLLDAIELNDDILEGVAGQGSVSYDWRRSFVFSQLRNLYILKDRFQPSIQDKSLGNSKDVFGATPIALDLLDQRLENLVQTAQTKARLLAEELRESAIAEGPVAEAQLELTLADWYFWNGQRGRANTGYRKVAQLLRDAGEYALLETWMGQPVELPEEGAFWVGRRGAESTPAEVRASFTVSSRGRVRDVEVQALNLDAEKELSRFKRNLSATLFRPRWDTGEAQAVEGVVREYQLLQ